MTQLKFLVENKHVNLLVPDILITEWQRHRTVEKELLETQLRDDKQEATRRALYKDASAEFLQEKIDEAFELLLSQLDTVDELLLNKSVRLSLTPELHVLVHEQRIAEKKPFGKKNKKDSSNDALLIFSSLNYLSNNNQSELYFVSDNKTDFALHTDDYSILHPEITERFPMVKTHYFIHIEETYKKFDILGIPRYKQQEDWKPGKIKNSINVDKTKSVLHQVYEYLEKRFSDLAFIPKKMFVEHYPFIKGETYLYRHRPFTLITDNQSVFDLFTKIKVQDDLVVSEDPEIIQNTDDENKLKCIFRTLAQNNITAIAFKDEDPVDIVYKRSIADCNCSLCQYRRLDWHDIINDRKFQERDNQDQTINGQLLIAYGHYKVGHYYQSAKLLQKLYNEKKEEKGLKLYIIAFNLKHLAQILRSHYWDNAEIDQLAKELSAVDLDRQYKECNSIFENREILQWLHQKKFISESLSVMHEKVNIITDHFYGQNTGFNDHVNSLVEQYSAIDSFLNGNGIIYDYYSGFHTLTDLLVQGLLASYGCNPLMGGRLLFLRDRWLNTLLLSAKADVIQKYLVRFKLKEIAYHPDEQPGRTFVDAIAGIQRTYPLIAQAFKEKEAHLSRFFWDTYSDTLFNAIVLLSMVELDAADFNRAMLQLLELLKSKTEISYFRLLKYLRFLFQRKQKSFSDEVLTKFYLAALENKEFHADRFFEIIVEILNERNIKVDLTESQFGLVLKNYLDELVSNHSQNIWFTTSYIFSTIANGGQKSIISARVNECLEQRFDSGCYYLAMMFELISTKAEYNKLYADSIEAIISQGQQKRPFATKEYYIDSRIDNYLNFCLKYSIEIPPGILQKVPAMGAYYRWLFNMDDFEYTNFSPNWLYNHFTFYYKRRFRHCAALKSHLLVLLKENPNTDLERIFVLIYCYED